MLQMLAKLGTVLLLLFFVIGGCGPDSSAPSSREEGKLLVAAASSVSLAFEEIGQRFEESTGGKVEFTFGSTGTLAQQIDNGAPFDVFAAADTAFVNELSEKGRVIPDTQQLYAQGRIGVAVPVESSLDVSELDGLSDPNVKKVAIASPEHAPYGMAAKQALQRSGLWNEVEPKLVYGKNIADALAFVTTGNAEAGIIAESIVVEGRIRFIPIDPALYEPLNQAIAVVEGTEQERMAREFVLFVNKPEGREIMRKYGFEAPSVEVK